MSKTDEWLALITPQHAGASKFMAAVSASVAPFSDIIDTLSSLSTVFDIDAARGVQLDMIGVWAGISRYIPTPLTDVYFTLGDATLGLGRGHLKGRFDPDSGLTELADGSYRVLLKGKIASNSWDGTAPGAYAVWSALFAQNDTGILIQDQGGMSILYALTKRAPDAVTQALFLNGFLSLKAAGVSISVYMTPYVDNVPYFGLGIQNDTISGLGSGAFGNIYPGI